MNREPTGTPRRLVTECPVGANAQTRGNPDRKSSGSPTEARGGLDRKRTSSTFLTPGGALGAGSLTL